MGRRGALEIQRSTQVEGDTSICQTLNGIANVYLQKGNVKLVVQYLADAARILRRAGRSEDELLLTGFNFLYGLAIVHPAAAAAA